MPKKLDFKPCRICGKPVTPIRRKDRKAWWHPRQCEKCKGKCRDTDLRHKRMSKAMSGMKNPNAVPLYTERIVDREGLKYIVIKVASIGKWPYKHRWIMEQHLGRKLKTTELVHHINHNSLDNKLENLQILSIGDHNRHHCVIFTWSKKYSHCQICGTNKRKHISHGLCSACYQQVRRKYVKNQQFASMKTSPKQLTDLGYISS